MPLRTEHRLFTAEGEIQYRHGFVNALLQVLTFVIQSLRSIGELDQAGLPVACGQTLEVNAFVEIGITAQAFHTRGNEAAELIFDLAQRDVGFIEYIVQESGGENRGFLAVIDSSEGDRHPCGMGKGRRDFIRRDLGGVGFRCESSGFLPQGLGYGGGYIRLLLVQLVREEGCHDIHAA